MWVGSMRSPLRTSANEELGPFAENNPLTKTSMERPVARLMISSLNLRVSWKPVNPQECVWKNFYQNIMRTILQEKETIDNNITIWHSNLFLCLTAMKIPAAKEAVDKEWEKLEKILVWNLTKVKTIQKSSSDSRPLNLHDSEFGDYAIDRPLSEKMQRSADKFITLLTKCSCPVSRRLSVMLEQGDLFSMSLDH